MADVDRSGWSGNLNLFTIPTTTASSSPHSCMTQRCALILLKEPRPDDAYVAAFRHLDLVHKEHIHCQPLLRHELCSLDQLHRAFSEGLYSGLVFTSQRAVEAWAAVLQAGAGERDPDTRTRWNQTLHYVVGQATAHALTAIPSSHAPQADSDFIQGQHLGHGEALAAYIARQHKTNMSHSQTSLQQAPLLYLTGDKRRDVLPQTLDQAQIAFEELCVYQTATDPAFPAACSNLLDRIHQELGAPVATSSRSPVVWVALFSPSGANAAVPLLQQHQELWPSVRLASLGPTTATHLREQFHIEAHAVAASPKPELLAQAIEEAMSSQNVEPSPSSSS